MTKDYWTKERISEIEDNEAREFIQSAISSPYFDGYVAVLVTIGNLNQELQNGVSRIESETITTAKGESIIADKNFERSHKFITEMQPYYEQLEYFRVKMLPNEVEEANVKTADLLDEARQKMKSKK